MITAVLFDLDDTLYDQQQWLRGAWRAVAQHAATYGADPVALEDALVTIAATGTDQGGIIDAALVRVGATDVPVGRLVRVFRTHAPGHLEPFPGVPLALTRLRHRVRLGIVSDGEPTTQANKLDALDLRHLFDTVVLSDEYGRVHRKPDPLPFSVALDALAVDAWHAVFIGDRPAKDVAGPAALGMRAVRVRTGEWHTQPDDTRAWASVPTVLDAISLVEHELDRPMARPA
jgi:putative hydrolase of the HAD superfamily